MRVILLVEATAAAVRPSEVGPGREPELIDRCLHRFPLGTTDSAVVAVGERLGITEIATLVAATSTRSGRGTPAASTRCPDLAYRTIGTTTVFRYITEVIEVLAAPALALRQHARGWARRLRACFRMSSACLQ
jgi:hypothetical protein